MTDALKILVEQVRRHQMTDAERQEQRISFAYGNVALENPSVTRESVREISEQMESQQSAQKKDFVAPRFSVGDTE